MNKFFGILVGGPGDGTSVTASVAVIEVKTETEMRLDGREKDKTVNITVTRGVYTWDPDAEFFRWTPLQTDYYIKRLEVD